MATFARPAGLRMVWTMAAIILATFNFAPAYPMQKEDDMTRAAGEVEAAAEAYRAAGLPWEAKDLRRGPKFSESQNAAPLIAKAGKLLDSKFSAEFQAAQKDIKAKRINEATNILAPYNRAFELAEQASKLHGFDEHLDPDRGQAMQFSYLTPLRGLVRGLCIRAELDAARQDFVGATSELSAAWKIGNFPAKEPFLIGVLVQVAMQEIVLAWSQRCVDQFSNNPKGLSAFLGMLDQFHPPDLAPVLMGEAYSGLATLRNFQMLGGMKMVTDGDPPATKPDWRHIARTGLPKDRAARAYATRYMQVWVAAKPVIDRFRTKPLQLAKELDRVIEKMTRQPRPSDEFLAISLTRYGQTSDFIASISAEILCQKAVIAGLQHRLKTGRNPATLADIPGKWIDPFNGRPLHFIPKGNGFRIYSVGPNLKDDGGYFRSDAQQMSFTRNYDVGATFDPAD